jgi:cadmium resistance protein CadD (predicted permease)
MTYQNLKDKIVTEQREMDSKHFKRFLVRYALMMFTLMIEFLMVAYSITNTIVALAVMFIFIFAFVWILDWCSEEQKVLNKFNFLSKIWFLNILIIVGTYILLKMTHFM